MVFHKKVKNNHVLSREKGPEAQVDKKVAHGTAVAKTLYIDQITRATLAQFLEEAQIYQKL